MANVYDVANDLEKALKESEDFKNLKMYFEAIQEDQEAKTVLDNFREAQSHLQQKQMMGEDITEEEVQKAQQYFELLQQHEIIIKLMEAEQRMSMVIDDINKVMMKPLEELYGVPSGMQ